MKFFTLALLLLTGCASHKQCQRDYNALWEMYMTERKAKIDLEQIVLMQIDRMQAWTKEKQP